jgi:hypothetical protein
MHRVPSSMRSKVGSNSGTLSKRFNELENLPPEHRASIEAIELRCRIYSRLERWKELEIVAAGCSGRKIEHIPFACHHAWALLKQNRSLEALAVLERVPYTCAPELLFTRACALCTFGEIEQAAKYSLRCDNFQHRFKCDEAPRPSGTGARKYLAE